MGDINFNNKIKQLTKTHYKNCPSYKKIINKIEFKNKHNNLSDYPFLPVNIFKKLELFSVKKNKIVKILNSSGTSNNEKSKIYLDKKNATEQKKVLNEIVQKLIGRDRLPMIIIAQDPKINKSINMGAREAGIFGFSIFGKNHFYLINSEKNIDYENLNIFLEKFSSEKFLIFGFTHSVYENLFNKILVQKLNYTFKNAILFHGGGWKKMISKKVSNNDFRKSLKNKIGLQNIYNYYGLVEQTGSIFFECQICHSFYTSKYSDIIIRDKNLNVIKKGRGLIQLLSTLPTSYPGHNILTEDEGELIYNDCECKNKGKQFKIHGRIKKSEIRGCSDT